MATRKGATKTVSGKRFRYNGTKWVQITGKGNVTPTSSSNRASRSKSATNTPTTDSGRTNRGGSSVTSDTTRTSTGSAKVTTKPKALPPGTKGGALATTNNRPRRTNVTNTPSRSGTQQASRTNSSRPVRAQLRAASTPSGTSKPTDGRRTPTRMESAKARAAQAAQGSRGSTTRTGAMSSKTRRGGPLSGLVEQGLTRLLSPAARGIGYQTGRAVRKALGGGEPTLDSKGNKITKPVYKGTGLKGVDNKPLPVPSDAFKKHIASKVPQSKDKPEKDTKVTPPASDKTPTKTPPKADNSPQRKAPTRKPKTGADDPRNKEYIAARSKLNAKSSKADRDKVRDLGMAVHNKKFGKTPKKKKKNAALAIGGYA